MKIFKAWVITIGVIVLVGILFIFSRSNSDILDSIDIDLDKVGVNIEELQEKFKTDPIGCRVAVDHHKRKRFMLVIEEQEKAKLKRLNYI